MSRFLYKFIKCERGNVESALVLIPLLTLFLITTQISIALHGRNLEKMGAQDIASKGALSGDFSPNDSFVHITSPDPNQNLDLVISRKERSVTAVIPGLASIFGHVPVTDVSGIAVIENQR